MAQTTLPFPILTDSYKITHPYLYPDAQKMVAYGEFRCGYDKDKSDTRIVFTGIRYIVENYVARKFTEEDVEKSDAFFKTHNAGFAAFPFPKDLFLEIVREHDGYIPVKIEAVPEGTVVYPHVPVYQITAEGKYARLVTFLETLLSHVWYPTTVATLSRRSKDVIQAGYEISVDQDGMWSLGSRLHDFGFRGCTSVEQSVIGGAAHLLNFDGTDTLSAAYYVQYHLNEGKPIGTSIPATEHSIMTAFRNEKLAIEHMISKFGSGVFACVMDSYDYAGALDHILPAIAKKKVEAGGYMVLRPDSGDPVEVVLMALRAAEKVFGADVNAKGFKVIRGAGVIQGDGINLKMLKTILDAAIAEKFSAQSIAFGMGAGLLQKVNRDTMSFATKLSFIKYADGTTRNIMKCPKTDATKVSLPGELAVIVDEHHKPTVIPKSNLANPADNLLQVIYENGKQAKYPTFEEVRARVAKQWAALPKTWDPIGADMLALITKTKAEMYAQLD